MPFYALKNSPAHESPWGLFSPEEGGTILEEEYGIPKRYIQTILRHTQYQHRTLNDDVNSMMKYLYQLWGFTVKLESINHERKITKTYQWPL